MSGRFISSAKNALNPLFREKLAKLVSTNFSRNTNVYSIFANQPISEINNFNMKCRNVAPEADEFMDGGSKLQKQILSEDVIPEKYITDAADLTKRLQLCSILCKNWTSPCSVENVGTASCDPGLMGSIIGLLSNPNLVHYEYCRMASDLEDVVTRMVSNLIGYDPSQSIGLFTQGGTMCNMYGYLAGIRKAFPQSRDKGLQNCGEYRFIISQAGHYSNSTVLSTLGVGNSDRILKMKLNNTNQIDLADFRLALEGCFKVNIKVPTILITIGSTDTFAVDDIKKVVDIRDEVCEKYKMEDKPHIHADSAVGWPILFFLDYDLKKNNLNINDQTLESITSLLKIFKYLHYADSFTIDFHKWGYTPYTSSMIVFKDKRDFYRLGYDPSTFTYFQSEDPTHKFECTFECSRQGVGIFGAYSTLIGLGKEGMMMMVANSLQNSNYLREMIKQNKQVVVWAGKNNGPSVGIRVYPQDSNAQFIYETTAFPDDPKEDDEYGKRVIENTNYHKELFKRMGNDTLSSSWVGSIGHSNYNIYGQSTILPGEKMVFFNPRTTREDIDQYLKRQLELCATLPKKFD